MHKTNKENISATKHIESFNKNDHFILSWLLPLALFYYANRYLRAMFLRHYLNKEYLLRAVSLIR